MEHPEISDTAAAKVRLSFNVPVEGRPQSVADVQALKEAAARFITLVEQIGGDKPASERLCARECALAITHIQTASFFAVYAATAP